MKLFSEFQWFRVFPLEHRYFCRKIRRGLPDNLQRTSQNKGENQLDKYVIHGGRRLTGEVEISGAKNAAVALIPAVLLCDEPCIL